MNFTELWRKAQKVKSDAAPQKRKHSLIALALFFVALAIYWGTDVWGKNTHSTYWVFFDQLADAFLNGRLYLINPPSTHDLTQYNGQWYVPFPPLGALLMLPWVALRGVSGTNAIFFSTFWGAINVAVVYLSLEALAERGWTRLSTRDNLWLTLLFALGSLHWYMATVGNVYFIAQTLACTFVALSVLLAIKGRPWWSGSMLALAVLSRPNVALAWPLLVAIWAQLSKEDGGRVRLSETVRRSLKSAVPLCLSVIALMAYNAARFGNPLDFGYLTQNVAPQFLDDLKTYGQFDLHYLRHNLWSMLLAGFRWEQRCLLPVPDPDGMSLFLTTPALVYLFRAKGRSPLVYGAWTALGLLLIPLITYYNTGFFQFGYRFSLDFMIPVVILLAMSAGDRVTWTMRAVIILGVIVNACGVAWWYKHWCA